MSAPMEELIGVATARLKAYAPLTALVPATSILLSIPASYTAPYITVEEAYSVRADVQCVDALDITMNVHVWTTAGTSITGGGVLQDARAIGWQVIKALHHYDLVLPNNSLITLANTGERTFYDVDNVTGHSVCSFDAIVEAA